MWSPSVLRRFDQQYSCGRSSRSIFARSGQCYQQGLFISLGGVLSKPTAGVTTHWWGLIRISWCVGAPYNKLLKLILSKTNGPHEIPNWLLCEYTDFLALPVSKIINSSFKEQRLLCMCKLANVSPLPKKKIVN